MTESRDTGAYLPMLPVVSEGRELFSLGEGWTPLIKGQLG